MRSYLKKSLSFFGFAALLLSLAGCFQSAGGDPGNRRPERRTYPLRCPEVLSAQRPPTQQHTQWKKQMQR